MIGMAILQPVAVLAGWTMLMLIWMYAVRIPAMLKTGIDVAAMRGGTGRDLDGKLPDPVQWKSHNYNHLHEAPTVFYAVAVVLAIIGQGDGVNAMLAWAYVALRIAHSLVQATFNRVQVRFGLYALSSLVLLVLVAHTVLGVFAIHYH